MQRRKFITLLGAALVAGAPVFAQSLRDTIISQLTEQGFSKVTVSRTWLGRLRFVATNTTYRREIVLNPNTGEVLRDLTVLVATGKPAGSVNISATPGTQNGGGSGGDGGSDDGGDNGSGDGGGDNGGGDGGGDDNKDDNQDDNDDNDDGGDD